MLFYFPFPDSAELYLLLALLVRKPPDFRMREDRYGNADKLRVPQRAVVLRHNVEDTVSGADQRGPQSDRRRPQQQVSVLVCDTGFVECRLLVEDTKSVWA